MNYIINTSVSLICHNYCALLFSFFYIYLVIDYRLIAAFNTISITSIYMYVMVVTFICRGIGSIRRMPPTN